MGEVSPASLQILVDILPVGQVVRDGAVYLLQAQNRKRLSDRLGRLPLQKRVDDQITDTPVPAMMDTSLRCST